MPRSHFSNLQDKPGQTTLAQFSYPLDPHLSLVLVDRGADSDSRYVVWTRNHEDGGDHTGHYTADYQQALRSFVNRLSSIAGL